MADDDFVLNLDLDAATKPKSKASGDGGNKQKVSSQQQDTFQKREKGAFENGQGHKFAFNSTQQQDRQPSSAFNRNSQGGQQRDSHSNSRNDRQAIDRGNNKNSKPGAGGTGRFNNSNVNNGAKQGGRGDYSKNLKAKGWKDEDEVQLKGADSDEDMEIANMVAFMSKRDEKLESELHKHRPSHAVQAPEEHVVDFEDDGDDGRFRKRNKFTSPKDNSSAHGSQHQGGARSSHSNKGKAGNAASSAVEEAMKQQPTKVTYAPGQLSHGDVGAAAQELFDDNAPAATRSVRDSVRSQDGSGQPPGSWASLGLDHKLSSQLASCRFERPTKVQAAAIPYLLERKDVLVRAATGSGKTLSYLVPIIQDLSTSEGIKRSDGTYAIIIAPTRELCLQIQDVAVPILKRFIWLVPGVVIGGENRNHEKARIRKGLTILAGTPGRLADHLANTHQLKTDKLRWLILDEADRLLDLGFEAKLREIITALDKRMPGYQPPIEPGEEGQDGDTQQVSEKQQQQPRQRTTALLSATLHKNLATLASLSLQDPVAVGFSLQQGGEGLQLKETAISTGDQPEKKASKSDGTTVEVDGETYVFPSQLKQAFMMVDARQRLVTLAGLLRQKLLGTGKPVIGEDGKPQRVRRKAVVFLASCDGVELHHTLLGGGAWRQASGGPLLGQDMPLLKLHGDMPQEQRTAAFVTFSKAERAVLLCTDVAARGLDFPDVTTIVQFDVPGAVTEYVHRVGRTARMGHGGEALLFLMPHERTYVDLLIAKGVPLHEQSCEGALRWLPQVAGSMDEEYMNKKRKYNMPKQDLATSAAHDLHRKVMMTVISDPSLKGLAEDAFRSFVRAYATHPASVKHVFHIKNLHLGHVAFAHGLKEKPTMVGASGSAAERKRKRAEDLDKKQRVAKKKLFKTAALLKA